MSQLSRGFFYGSLGMICFGLTLPATRFAVRDIDPTVVAMGRACVAAVLSMITLYAFKQRLPAREHWWPLVLVALGAVIAFPMFVTVAMAHVDASHGGIVLGLLPLTTACFAVLVGHERPSFWFWVMAVLGSALVVGYAIHRASGEAAFYDLLLFLAVASASLAYAIGAKLTKPLGSWQVICWALVVSVPVIVPAMLWRVHQVGFSAHLPSWLGFIYVSLFSMFLGFFPWYKGLALGGTAKVGLVQLLQPFVTILASCWLLGETLATSAIMVLLGVSACILLAMRARVHSHMPVGNEQPLN